MEITTMPSVAIPSGAIDGWLSQEELVARWKVSKQTIRRLRQSGKLPAFAITRALFRFKLVDILRLESEGVMLPSIGAQRRQKPVSKKTSSKR